MILVRGTIKNKTTKILLVKAPDVYTKYGRGGEIWLPIELAELAAYVLKHNKNVNIEIFSPHLEKLPFRKVVNKCCSGNYDIIGISYMTVSADYAYQLSSFIKKFTKSLLVHGGTHVTLCPNEVIEHCDIGIIGEGELTFSEIIEKYQQKALTLSKIKGIVYKENNNIKITPSREFIKDMDEMPFPRYDLLPMDKYDKPLHYTGERMIDIMESRGCPYNCSFCVSPTHWRRRLRMHSPQYIINHIKLLIKNYNITNFHFHGDNFMIQPGFVKRLCDLIIKNKLKIKWCALTRPEHVIKHKNLLPLMKKAGCFGIEIGIDSAEENALAATNKGQDLSTALNALKILKKKGMILLYTLMGFNPEETIYGYYKQQIVVFKKIFGFDTIKGGQASTPYPSTDYGINYGRYGVLLAHTWDEYDHSLIPFIPNSLLDGKPLRTKKKLWLNDYYIIIGGYYNWRVDIFPVYNSLFTRFFLSLDYMRRLKRFYSLCFGKYTLREIATIIENHTGMKHEESMRFCGFCTLILAKMGLITDANLDPIKRAEIKPIYKGFSGNLKSLFIYILMAVRFYFGNKERIKGRM
ncbi:radical SAM protein [Candidatus Woesearchaeota archaeon]|nr:radical SAM protein [Candidatus Woesearchaeota archaeon]